MAMKDEAARATGIVSFVEGLEDRTLSGWAYDAEAPDRPLELALLVDDEVRAVFQAEIDRPDVQDAGHAALTCGFALTLPRDVPGGVPVTLKVQARASGQLLENGEWRGELPAPPPEEAPLPAPAAAAGPQDTPFPLQGAVEILEAGGAAGWVQDPADPGRAIDLCIMVDDEVAGMAVADQQRKDVQEAGHARLNCGFRFALPEAALDGKPHRIRIVENDSGAILPGGEAEITAPFEGVVFLRPAQGAVVGWARPVKSVRLRFDDGESVLVATDQPVAGFLADNIVGFSCPVPEALRDGAWHRVSAEHPSTGAPLDGSPLSFRLGAEGVPQLRDVFMLGRRFHGRVTDHTGAPLTLDLAVEAGGRRLLETRSDQPRVAQSPDADSRNSNHFSFPVPRGISDFALLELRAEAPPRKLASCRISETGEGQTVPALSQELSDRTLSDADTLAAIRARFDRFCAAPEAPFDPVWYALTHMGQSSVGTDPAEALAHYAGPGHASGHAPTPLFEEATVCRLYPAIGRAVREGRVPCAFAVYLYLGGGDVLQTLAAPAVPAEGRGRRALAMTQAPAEVPTQGATLTAPPLLPAGIGAPSAERDPAESVYAAWMARLKTDAATRAALEADEAGARAFIRRNFLTRKPLVSIIMPTFNRAYTIGDAIQSALDQGYDNFELLICDDASDDRTPEVIKQFDDPRIRYFQFAKSNGAGARNKGLRFARGEYIAYLDSDNLWNPHFLDLMLRRLMLDPGRSIAFSGYLDTTTTGSRVDLEKVSRPAFNPVALSGKNFMDLNTIMHHRRVYDWLGGFDGALPRLQDWDLMLRYTSVFRPVPVDHAMVYYRRNVAWGQVTHLHMGGNAQDLVNAKTAARLEDEHVRLALDWPARPRLVLLCPEPGDLATGLGLAGLAAPLADVELISPEAPADLPEGVRHSPALAACLDDPDRLAYLLSLRGGADPVIRVDGGPALLEALQGSLPDEQIFSVELDESGLVLRNLASPPASFHLGVLPVPGLGQTVPAPRPDRVALFPGKGESLDMAAIAAEAGKLHLEVLIAPEGEAGDWHHLTAGGTAPVAGGYDAGARMALETAALALVLPPRPDLSIRNHNLLARLQAAGLPLALRPGPLSDEILRARCGYPLEVDRLDWIFDKAAKLLKSAKDMDRLTRASRTAHAITHHPELVQERIAVFLHLSQAGLVRSEVYQNA